jgi:hypothetical protein
MAISKSKWKWYGNAGHFICSDNCRFHITTEVGKYLISTVGEYFPDSGTREILASSRGIKLEGIGDERKYDYMKKIGFEDLGYNRKYETMVFRIGTHCNAEDCACGLPRPIDWSEIDSGGYNSAKDATNGHTEMCQKWSREKCQTMKL